MMASRTRSWWLALLFIALIPCQVLGAFVRFQNCLPPSIKDSKSPVRLQFVPLFVDTKFNTEDPKHKLGITVYGNVTGQREDGPYPPPSSPVWQDKNSTFGQITDATTNYTTLLTDLTFLSYTPYKAAPSRFCQSVGGDGCPLPPLFGKNASDPAQLHSFNISHNMESSYAFTSIGAHIQVQSGDIGAPLLACVTVSVTPDLGASLSGVFRWIPIVILGMVGLATVLAAKFHPTSSKLFFYWTSNYGRDQDMIRLITPGFGDCLQYIQFIVLTGCLSLDYPGFYQPVVSKAAWSTLTFNESFVTHGKGYQSLTDGVYNINATYGLTELSQLVGMTDDTDMWAGMAVWLLVIVGIVVVICQIGFTANWAVKQFRDTPPEDLRNKNVPFTIGNVTRIVFNFFLLPIISISIFQLVISGKSPAFIVALAALLVIAITLFAGWAFFLIFKTKPRVHLFDHLSSLLLYGPLYNTYSDEAAPFAFIPVALNFMRGIAIGAVQASGIAQLVILAICEIIFILTVHAFRPFPSITSMNAYHTFFSVIRLTAVLMSIAFVPALEVDEGSKGWIGCVLLFLHAFVLVFGFFMNSIQTLIEVFARMAGVEERSGLARVLGVRQLSKRAERRHDSLGSNAAILEAELKNRNPNRMTHMSHGSSNRHSSLDRHSQGQFDRFSQIEDASVQSGTSPGPSTPGGTSSPFSFLASGDPRGHQRGQSSLAAPAPYYRPPRQRRPTLETANEYSSIDFLGTDGTRSERDDATIDMVTRRNSIFSTGFREEGDPEATRKQPDYYSSREVDYLYGVQRGPALSSTPSRRGRVTGPADPMSPVTSAAGWFRGLFAGRRKEKGKGFEVVRSTPLHLLRENEEEHGMPLEPYSDHPQARSLAGPSTSREMIEEVGAGESAAGKASNADTAINMDADTAYKPPTHAPSQSSRAEDTVQRTGSFQRTAYTANDNTLDTNVPFAGSRGPSQRTGATTRTGSLASSVYPPSMDEMEHQRRLSELWSTGQVHQRLAGESVHAYTLNPAHEGSTAELVEAEEERRRRASRQSSRSQSRDRLRD